jgi:hypothetical protein
MRYRYEYRHGIWHIDLRYGILCLVYLCDVYLYVIYHIDMVILDVDMGYGLLVMVWEMTVSIRSSSVLTWDILSLWRQDPACGVHGRQLHPVLLACRAHRGSRAG